MTPPPPDAPLPPGPGPSPSWQPPPGYRPQMPRSRRSRKPGSTTWWQRCWEARTREVHSRQAHRSTPIPPAWQPQQLPGYQLPHAGMMPPGQLKPPRRKLGCIGWFGIGVAGLMALIVITSLTGNSNNDSTGGGSSQASSGSGGSETAQVASGSEVARDGDFAFQVKAIACGQAEAQAVYTDPDITGTLPPGTQECIIKLRVTDDKSVAQAFFDSNQYAYDAKGQQFSADNNGMYLTGDKDDTQLNPGVSITALVPFNIPSGDSITRLQLHDSEFSGGVTVNL